MKESSLALLTDLYQLTMAQGYYLLGMKDRWSCFHLFFRKKPFGGEYAIFAGLEPFLEFLENFSFSREDLDYLSSLESLDGSKMFAQEFLVYLSDFRFSCDLFSVKEGSVIFPNEPYIRAEGKLLECQLLETPLLNYFNFSTLIATKASRIKQAVKDDVFVEFGLRRAQGINGGLTASRSAFIGGADSTSNVLAGKMYDIPVSGTQAHSWIMAHSSEEEAFENFAKVSPHNCAFLIDTYNTVEGAKKAIEIAKKLEIKEVPVRALRLDSGDMIALSQIVRTLLDENGLSHIKIMATNELDEELIENFKEKGAKIDIWGVGTHLVTARSQPALDGVYKLSAIEDERGVIQKKLKKSDTPEKTTNPGKLQVRRYFSSKEAIYDVIYDEMSGICKDFFLDPNGQSNPIDQKANWLDLLASVVKNGKRVNNPISTGEIKKYKNDQIKKFNKQLFSLKNPKKFIVGIDPRLQKEKDTIIKFLD